MNSRRKHHQGIAAHAQPIAEAAHWRDEGSSGRQNRGRVAGHRMRVRCGQHGLYGARSRNGEVGLRQELGNGKQRVHRRAFDDVRVSCTPSRARTRSGSGNGAAMGRRVTSRSGLVGRGPAAKACVRGPRPIIVVAGLALSAQYGMRTGRRALRIGPRPRECWAGSTANPPAAQATVFHSADNNVVQKHSAVPSVG